MTTSERLTVMLAPLMNSSRGTLWDDPQITVIYPEYLATLHDIVRATVPELEQALDRSQRAGGRR